MSSVSTRPGQAEDQARFEQLARAVHGPLARYLARRTGRDTAADVLAETLTVLWRRLDDVPAANELPWCYGVARRCLANSQRSERRRQRLLARIVLLDPPSEESDLPDGDERAEQVRRHLAHLAPADQEVLRLWAWEGLEPREIALVLDVTPNAASIRLHRAKTRLRTALIAGDGKAGAGAGHEPDVQGGGR